MGRLVVLDGGLFTTVQDAGRFGFRKYGVPVSGVMDEDAYQLANSLVGNSKEEPVLECTVKGGKYLFESDALISITGSLMKPTINEQEIAMNEAIQIHKGDALTLSFAKRGCRAYIAIKGEWCIPKVMGSSSTYVPGNFGGLNGCKLEEGSTIEWKEITEGSEIGRLNKDLIPYYSSKITIEFIAGPEWDLLLDEEKEKLCSTAFVINSSSNRMGIRLNTKEPFISKKEDMISAGVIPGIIQLPPSGNPIILMRDAQTVGGYPRIGKVKDRYLNRLAQLPLNGTVKLKKAKF